MKASMDRLTLLETFSRIVDRGSISAAARDLGLSQASASRQLKQLEDRLGEQLIRRTTHTLAVTEAGREVLQTARELLGAWDALEDGNRAVDGPIRGPLKVVAPVALGQLQLAEIALDFQLANPQVTLTWLLEDEAIRFAEQGCDCWIKVGPVPDDRLIVRSLARVERLVVASPDIAGKGPVAEPSELKDMPFAALQPFEGHQIMLHAKGRDPITLSPPVVFETNNIFALHRAALKHVGAVVLPRWFVERDLAEGRLINLLPAWNATELEVSVAFLPARRQPQRLERFLAHLVERIGDIPGMLPPR